MCVACARCPTRCATATRRTSCGHSRTAPEPERSATRPASSARRAVYAPCTSTTRSPAAALDCAMALSMPVSTYVTDGYLATDGGSRTYRRRRPCTRSFAWLGIHVLTRLDGWVGVPPLPRPPGLSWAADLPAAAAHHDRQAVRLSPQHAPGVRVGGEDLAVVARIGAGASPAPGRTSCSLSRAPPFRSRAGGERWWRDSRPRRRRLVCGRGCRDGHQPLGLPPIPLGLSSIHARKRVCLPRSAR